MNRQSQTTQRPAAVAGMFYPLDPRELREQVQAFLDEVQVVGASSCPKALIVPHAGYVYSGPVAASAYARLLPHRGQIQRVALFGPAHRVALHGVAIPSQQSFLTPLGAVQVGQTTLADLSRRHSEIVVNDTAHRLEHSLEVQLPFLQWILIDFSLLPFVVGQVSPEQVSTIMEEVCDAQTLILVSTDLSHYHRYEEARRWDGETAQAILKMHGEQLGPDDACGYTALRALLLLAQRRGWGIQELDRRNSGDTAGDHRQVVGYGAYGVYADT